MNTDIPADLPKAPAPPAAALPPTRLLYWSVRRELWENRAIVLAPLIAAGVVLFAALIAALRLPPEVFREAAAQEPMARAVGAVKFYGGAALPVMVTALLVGVFYCLDALYGERRDRSILFWKSLPVSDAMTVLSKAVVALLVLPLAAIAVTLALQLVLLLLGSAALAAHGYSAALMWSPTVLPQVMWFVVYAALAFASWYAPIAAWLLLVSAWAKRTPILWAVLPPLALMVIEHIAFSTRYFAELLGYRLVGGESDAFDPGHPLLQPAPLHYLVSPGLWLGLLAAAALLFVAVRLRRGREPI